MKHQDFTSFLFIRWPTIIAINGTRGDDGSDDLLIVIVADVVWAWGESYEMLKSHPLPLLFFFFLLRPRALLAFYYHKPSRIVVRFCIVQGRGAHGILLPSRSSGPYAYREFLLSRQPVMP
jgi:hypothetical protein